MVEETQESKQKFRPNMKDSIAQWMQLAEKNRQIVDTIDLLDAKKYVLENRNEKKN